MFLSPLILQCISENTNLSIMVSQRRRSKKAAPAPSVITSKGKLRSKSKRDFVTQKTFSAGSEGPCRCKSTTKITCQSCDSRVCNKCEIEEGYCKRCVIYWDFEEDGFSNIEKPSSTGIVLADENQVNDYVEEYELVGDEREHIEDLLREIKPLEEKSRIAAYQKIYNEEGIEFLMSEMDKYHKKDIVNGGKVTQTMSGYKQALRIVGLPFLVKK